MNNFLRRAARLSIPNRGRNRSAARVIGRVSVIGQLMGDTAGGLLEVVDYDFGIVPLGFVFESLRDPTGFPDGVDKVNRKGSRAGVAHPLRKGQKGLEEVGRRVPDRESFDKGGPGLESDPARGEDVGGLVEARSTEKTRLRTTEVGGLSSPGVEPPSQSGAGGKGVVDELDKPHSDIIWDFVGEKSIVIDRGEGLRWREAPPFIT